MTYIENYFSSQNYNEIKAIANEVYNNNGKIYLVGGALRDMILGSTPKDYDYCVTGIDKDNFEKIFPDAIIQGKSFPVYILNGYEFALARKEIKIGKKHTDFNFITNSKISITDDLARRDLTINSIALDIIDKKIIDPFGGIKDIKNKTLRMTSNAFKEDPLRVYRVARFASQLNFKVEKNTIAEMKNIKGDLYNLSAERVFTEFRKALISKAPTNFFNVLKFANCLDVHFKEIYNLIDVIQPIKYHPEGDVYNHTMEVLDNVSKNTDNEYTRFGALVHDFGKASTPKEILPHHYNHEENGIPLVENFCHRLKMPNQYLKAGKLACKEHTLAGMFNILKTSTKVDFIERVYKNKALTLEGLELIANYDVKKEPQITFAYTGNKLMETVKLTSDELKNISNNINKIKQKLREKRINYLKSLH